MPDAGVNHETAHTKLSRRHRSPRSGTLSRYANSTMPPAKKIAKRARSAVSKKVNDNGNSGDGPVNALSTSSETNSPRAKAFPACHLSRRPKYATIKYRANS